ncbi:hypothetical protein [Marinobacter nauticus]|uniref:hypothetical protein n=1 Tax=Marinobacter nauticus TaxID=2743 RepID=UPI000EB0E242|nr:hypothetical protein [Marinobacter nauticus]RKR79225.1 hypothetical protein C7436_0663 [Marinobacter nauticus]
MSDYTKLPRDIAECMRRAGSPLSEDQRLLLAGYLAPVQQKLADSEARVAELEGSIKHAIGWIDGDLRELIRDMGNTVCTYNDLYDAADRIEAILAQSLRQKAAEAERAGGEK